MSDERLFLTIAERRKLGLPVDLDAEDVLAFFSAPDDDDTRHSRNHETDLK